MLGSAAADCTSPMTDGDWLWLQQQILKSITNELIYFSNLIYALNKQ